MKKLYTFVALSCLANMLVARQSEIRDFYFLSPLLINPALAGQSAGPVFTQISSIPTDGIDGSPQAYVLAYDQRIKSINSGVGAIVSLDKVGIYSEWRHTLAYNYRFRLSDRTELALGGSFFMIHTERDYNRIIHRGTPPGPTGLFKTNYFSYDLGAALTFSDNTKAGAALLNSPYSILSDDPSDPPVRVAKYLTLFVQHDFTLSKWLRLTPSVFCVTTESLPAVINLNTTAYLGRWFFVGGQYSSSGELSNSSNIFAGVTYKDIAKVGVKMIRKVSAFYYPLAGWQAPLSFTLQVSPRKRETEPIEKVALTGRAGQ